MTCGPAEFCCMTSASYARSLDSIQMRKRERLKRSGNRNARANAAVSFQETSPVRRGLITRRVMATVPVIGSNLELHQSHEFKTRFRIRAIGVIRGFNNPHRVSRKTHNNVFHTTPATKLTADDRRLNAFGAATS